MTHFFIAFIHKYNYNLNKLYRKEFYKMKKTSLLIFPLFLLALTGCNEQESTSISENSSTSQESSVASLPSLPEPTMENDKWYYDNSGEETVYFGYFSSYDTLTADLTNITIDIPEVSGADLYYAELYLSETNVELILNPIHEGDTSLTITEYNTYVALIKESSTDFSDLLASDVFGDSSISTGMTVAQYFNADYVLLTENNTFVLLSYSNDYGMIIDLVF